MKIRWTGILLLGCALLLSGCQPADDPDTLFRAQLKAMNDAAASAQRRAPSASSASRTATSPQSSCGSGVVLQRASSAS